MSERRQNSVRLFLDGAVIVGSILLAFAIEAWWDGRQEEQHRASVAVALTADFESARGHLGRAIEASRDLLARTEALQSAAGQQVALPQDSIVFLALSVVVGEFPPPTLPRYRAAMAAGEINLLQSDSLLLALNDFESRLASYGRFQDHMLAAFVSGALHDIRRELGTLSALNPAGGRMPTPTRFTPADLNEVVQRRSVYAAVETVHVARHNYFSLLEQMDAAAVRVLSALRLIDADAQNE